MRFSAILALAAAAMAQTTTGPIIESVAIIVNNGSSTSYSSFTYSNGATSFLTQTDSRGVVTGQPTQPAASVNQPGAVTTQPPVATIPAGLPSGLNTIYLNVSRSLTSFVVSVGSSTTAVVGGGAPTNAVVTTGSSAGLQSGSAASGSASGSGASATSNGGSASTASSSAAASSSKSAAAPNVKLASAGLLGLGALFAALL